MNRELAMKVANAVLYEGYMLYPYRPSAIKNRQRWSFGILYPADYNEVHSGTERSSMHSECLLEIKADPKIHIQLRFLHLASRQINQLVEERLLPVPSLVIDEQIVEARDEGIERSVEFEVRSLTNPQTFDFSFPSAEGIQPLRDSTDHIVGSMAQTQHAVTGTLSVSSERLSENMLKLTVDIANTTSLPEDTLDRNAALLRSLLSAHTIIIATGADFISLLDPPEHLRDAAHNCKNIGNFPVLVGSSNERDMLLCSPIILYDYPQIAPESAGDFCDATEMDEMLTLRVITLSDEEKNEMRLGGDHVRKLLERTEQSAREQLIRTHGTIRSLRPVSDKP